MLVHDVHTVTHDKAFWRYFMNAVQEVSTVYNVAGMVCCQRHDDCGEVIVMWGWTVPPPVRLTRKRKTKKGEKG